MSKVILQGYITVPRADLVAIERELPRHIELTQQEEGCLAFKVLQDLQDRHRFNVYEEFASRSAFELHQERVRSSNWGKISANVERHSQIDNDD